MPGAGSCSPGGCGPLGLSSSSELTLDELGLVSGPQSLVSLGRESSCPKITVLYWAVLDASYTLFSHLGVSLGLRAPGVTWGGGVEGRGERGKPHTLMGATAAKVRNSYTQLQHRSNTLTFCDATWGQGSLTTSDFRASSREKSEFW